MTPSATAPELSVVVSVPRASRALAECLAALTQQIAAIPSEILVVTADPRDAGMVAERFPHCALVERAGARNEPELLGRGVARARGRVIAVTSATCVPGAEWIAQIMRMQADYHSAVGGPLELSAGAGILGAAAYFSTCASYMPPLGPGLGNVSSSNASYKRAALAGQMPAIETRGFWELDVNDQLRAEMRSLWREPQVVVAYHGLDSVRAFSAERAAHGRGLGRLRAGRSTRGKRMYYLARSPLMPFVYWWRAARQMLRQKQYGVAFWMATPLLGWFLLCQVAGEFTGLSEGAGR